MRLRFVPQEKCLLRRRRLLRSLLGAHPLPDAQSIQELMAGRDIPAELATFKEALTLKLSTAQRLLNGDD
jgi:hypothetical protein